MKQSFKVFLLSRLTKGSTDSYLTYVNKAFEFFSGETKKYADIYARLQGLNHPSRVRYCEYLIGKIKIELLDPATIYNKEYLHKYKAGIMQLLVFADNKFYAASGKGSFTKTANTPWDYNDVFDNFVFRLETQDRLYPKIKACFPCRLFGKIFDNIHKPTLKKLYCDMRKAALDRTKFLVNANRDYVTLSQVEKLLTSYGIKLWTASNQYDLFTDVFSNNKYLNCQATKAKSFNKTTLDHDEPLSKIVERKIDTLPELKKVSDAYWTHYKTTGLSGSHLSTSFYNNVYLKMSVDEAQLLDDAIEIYNDVEMTMMDQKFNSGISNRIIATPPLGTNLK